MRIGIHIGEPFLGYDTEGRVDYFGPMVNRAARTASAGRGGQILLSSATREIVEGALTGDVELVDLGRHRLRGLEHAEHLFEVRHPDLPLQDFPPLRTLDDRATNLPADTSSFVGREAEVAQIAALLENPANRLVTITGFGGMGKTRVALKVAARCADRFEDGVWWIDLHEARNREAMLQRLAEELPLDLEPEREVKEQIIGYLRDRQMLLALDNLEQIPGAAQEVSELLRAAPRLNCLAVSREATDLQVEQRYELPPMPPADCEELFLKRARARQPAFGPPASAGEDRASAEVAELCRRLEGVPLAVELAASWVAAMTPAEMLRHLDERFRLLRREAPDLPERLRTLRGTIDWSYDLLDEPQREIFARFSVFRGGCFLPAAEAVCGLDALEGLRALREKSLLQGRDCLGRMRYTMLESLRDYAAEKLGDPVTARAAHAAHFLRQAEQMARQLDSAGEEEALEELALEMENLRAAWEWAGAAADDAFRARLALANGDLLRRRGLWQERLAWLQEGLAAAERCGALAPEETAQLQYQLGYAHLQRGELDAARPLLEASLQTCRDAGDLAGEANCLNRLGNHAYQQGQFGEAQRFYEEALALCRMSGDTGGESGLLNNLGVLAQEQGDLPGARRYFEESLQIDRQSGNTAGIALQLNNVGRVAIFLGDLDEAERLLDESLQLNSRLGNPLLVAHAAHNLGDVARRRGDRSAARRRYQEALAIRRELDAVQDVAESLVSLGTLLAEEQKWPEAVLLLTAAEVCLSEGHTSDIESAREALRRIEEAIGESRLAQLQMVARRFTLAQAAERAVAMG